MSLKVLIIMLGLLVAALGILGVKNAEETGQKAKQA